MTSHRLIIRITFILSAWNFVGCTVYRNTLSYSSVRADKNGKRPKDIAVEFIHAAQTRNKTKAASYFADGELIQVEYFFGSLDNYLLEFNDYSADKVSTAIKDKGEYHWVYVRPNNNEGGNKKIIYLKKVKEEWRICSPLQSKKAEEG